MQRATDRVAARFLEVFQQIVADEQVRTSAGDGTTAAYRIEGTTGSGIEAAERRAVRREAASGEDRMEQGVGHQIANPSSNVVAQVLAVSCIDHAALRMPAEIPADEERKQEGLTMSWRRREQQSRRSRD